MADEAGGEGEETLARELGRQAEKAADALRAAALRLLREGAVDPRPIVLAMARVTGEMAASTALAAGLDGEGLLRDVLVVVGRACRDHGAALGLATGPAAGNA
jgi:hypothetical protein